MVLTTKAQVHRFREYVAVYLGNGETVYLEPNTALEISNKLAECVLDIKKNTFTASEFKTWEL